MSHVVGAGSAHVGALQEQVGETVQAQAGGEGAEEAVQPPQGDAEGPADEQQDHQPDDAPETGTTTGHSGLGEERETLEMPATESTGEVSGEFQREVGLLQVVV